MASETTGFKVQDLITVPAAYNTPNVYQVVEDLGENLLVNHPLFPDLLFLVAKSAVNVTAANLKNSSERGLDFVKAHKSFLDFDQCADLEALSMYFIIRRKLTNPQLKRLADMQGIIAKNLFNNDLSLAMKTINENSGILDYFNAMWYKNYSKIFSSKQAICSPKQVTTIFNMAGFVLSEMANPRV